MTDNTRSLHDFQYVCGTLFDNGAERIYKTPDGLYLRIYTRKNRYGEWGKGRRSLTRTPDDKRSWKEWKEPLK